MCTFSLIFPAFLFFSSSFFTPISGDTKYVAAGHVYCTTTGTVGATPETPAKGVKIGLWEQDGDDGKTSIGIQPGDDHMGVTVSNDQGEFSVTGSTGEIGDEEIYLFLKHRCTSDATQLPPSNEKCYYTAKVELLDVLKDTGPTEVQNLKIYLGKNAASSDNKTLPVKSDWDWASHC